MCPHKDSLTRPHPDYLFYFLQVQQGDVPRLLVADDDFLVSVHIPIGHRRRGCWNLLQTKTWRTRHIWRERERKPEREKERRKGKKERERDG